MRAVRSSDCFLRGVEEEEGLDREDGVRGGIIVDGGGGGGSGRLRRW
jgi:hypothetical protein